MAGALVPISDPPTLPAPLESAPQEFVTLRLGEQLFGIPVMLVRDVMRHQRIAPVPLAPAVIAGVLNLRGRIVTAFDLRHRLGLPPHEHPENLMLVVVDYEHELFALMVDAVGDVLSLAMNRLEKIPTTMDESWRGLATGIFKLESELLVILDIHHVVALEKDEA